MRQRFMAMQIALTFEKERNPIMSFTIVAQPFEQLTLESISKTFAFSIEDSRKAFFVSGPSAWLLLDCFFKRDERCFASLPGLQNKNAQKSHGKEIRKLLDHGYSLTPDLYFRTEYL